MDEQIFYSKQLAKTLLLATLTMMIGVAVGYFLLHSQSLLVLMAAGLAFAGIPSGWGVTSHFFGQVKNLNLLGIAVKLLAACLIGWAVLPVQVVYCMVKCCLPWGEEAAYAA